MKLSTTNFEIKRAFQTLPQQADHSFIEEAHRIERSYAIENHPFFSYAMGSKKAMLLWTSQEAIVTNPFSQILFRLLSNIENVHVRSVLIPVAHGEHSSIRKGTAHKSHPWLIWRLCNSIGIDPNTIEPTEAVNEFIKTLELSTENPMYGLGVLGIGNELMLLAEYGAVMKCFDATFPHAEYRDFLQANIGEDEVHSRLMGDAAAYLAQLGYSKTDFLNGARDGVVARIRYYDKLLVLTSNIN